MGAFLCFMAVRLLEMHRILKPTGTIYLHCDPTASHYLKELMDAIFGRDNFRNEIIWHYGKMSNSSRNFPSNHDLIFRYTKTDNYTFNPIHGGESEYRNRFIKFIDRNNCVPWGAVKSKVDKLILGRAKKIREELGRELRDADILFNFNKEFKIQSDVIYRSIIKGNSKEKTGYPTQKPISLYETFIEASSNGGDMVLDPFCGCATTLIAAEQLGRQWIGIDLWKRAHKIVWNRLKEEWLETPEGERKGLAILKPDGVINYQTMPPIRTDDGEEAVPFMKDKKKYHEPKEERKSRNQIFRQLAEQNRTDKGIKCVGCNRFFDDELYLQLDHNIPRSQGGINHISNRMLLCGPCNLIKGDKYTLRGLQAENKKRGRML